MSIYRRKFYERDDKGRTLKPPVLVGRSEHWTIEVRHPVTRKIIRRRGPKDRKAAKVMETQLLTDLERGGVGLADPFRDQRGVPIRQAIDDFAAKLESEGCDDRYVYITRKRLERVVRECTWATPFDATQKSFEDWRSRTAKSGANDRPTKAKTLNQFLASLNEFFGWCEDTGRIDRNPLAKVRKAKEIANDSYRRSATTEEIERFLAKLPTDDLRRFYVFLAYTALRRASLEALRWNDLDLGARPSVTVRGDSNKPGLTQRFVLRHDVAAMMRAAKGSASGTDPVFDVPTIEEHRRYLEAAGIAFADADGSRRLDLHAFRRTLHTWLEDAGVDVREASKALGHLHLSTTMRSYRERRDGRGDAGVERLPVLIKGSDAHSDAPKTKKVRK